MMMIRANGLDFYIRIDGPTAGAPLVLLHSLGTAGAVWDDQARVLARTYRVIRPDLRGHGLSEVTPGPYRIETLAADMLAVLDALGITRAHLAGISIGGLIAQAMAAESPDRFISLVLCDTAMAFPPASLWTDRAATVRAQGMTAIADAVLARWVTPEFASSPQANLLRAMLLRTPVEGYCGAAEALSVADFTESTARIRLPTLILVGDQDAATPPANAQAIQRAISGSVMEVIPGAAHIPTVEKPDLITEAMSRFLSPPVVDPYAEGMAVRRQVLGSAHVDRATKGITPFDADFQAFITRTAWGGVWTRPGLDRRTRSLLTLGLMAALGHEEEFKLHIRASRNTGATREDITELLIQVAVYAGVPAANSAIRVAKELFKEMDAE
jgi:3-oxoadipate enol-lactonase / 4-carboxymuconolactone decarboxylase